MFATNDSSGYSARMVSSLGPTWKHRLESDADQAMSLRSLPGSVVYAVLSAGFSTFTELGARFPLSWALTAASVAAGALRFLVLLKGTHAGPRSERDLARWRRLSSATSYLCVGLWAVHVAAVIHLLGVGVTPILMLLATTGLAFGGAHGLSPRLPVMRACAVILLVPPFCALVATSEGPTHYSLAALMPILLLYVLFLGRRLGIEYWSAALACAQVEIGRDELLRSQNQTRELIAKTPDAMGILCADEILFVNPAWTSSLQCESADLIGRRLEDLALPADVERLRVFLLRERPSASEEFTFVKRDGTRVTWEISPGEALEYDGRHARPVVCARRHRAQPTPLAAAGLRATRFDRHPGGGRRPRDQQPADLRPGQPRARAE